LQQIEHKRVARISNQDVDHFLSSFETKMSRFNRNRQNLKKRHASAGFNLGEAYIAATGGMKENKEKAIKWIKSSAEHGHIPAQEVFVRIEKRGSENA